MASTTRQGAERALNDQTGFAWKICQTSMTSHSVKVAEVALDSAIEYSSKLKVALQAILGQEETDLTPGSSDARLKDWIGRIDSFVSASKDLEILVGVAGDSGLGKTALLNAVLGYRDLLPSSNQSAATATVCKIAWNDDPNPKKKFKAEVVFRQIEDVRTELEGFFNDLENRRKLRAKYDNPLSGDESDSDQTIDQDTLDEVDASISDGLEKIEAIWGLDMDQLEKMTAADVLGTHKELTQCLSSTKEISCQDLTIFSKTIKPYLDSTEAEINGKRYTVWPLIDHVRLFVKSDILKNHVVLVDLPGLSDATGTRSAVAMRFFQQLDITCIVSPGHRGADNKSAVQLMGSNLEMAMKLDGRFNCQRFCAVLTKIDDIDYSSFVKDSRESGEDLGLQEAARGLDHIKAMSQQLKAHLQIKEEEFSTKNNAVEKAKAEVAEAEKALKDMRRTSAGAARVKTKENELERLRQELVKVEAAAKSQYAAVLNLTREIELRMRNAIHWEGTLIHQCVTARNTFLRKRIEEGYNKAQARLGVDPGPDDGNVIQVFPTSSKAFWAIHVDPRNPLTGFCDLRYTGIPCFKAWIRSATIPQRETHARVLLNSLHELLNQIETWSNDYCKGVDLNIDRATLQRDHLEPLYAKVHQRLLAIGFDLAGKVKQCDPFHTRRKVTNSLRKTVCETVDRWCYVDPRDKKCKQKLHWLTFRAIINRKGGVYRSKGMVKKTFTWMEDMATDFLTEIVEAWNQALHVKLPQQALPAREKVGKCWDEAIRDVADRLMALFPAEEAYLDKQIQGLLPIREIAKDMVADRIQDVSDGTQGVHTDVARLLGDKWDATFKKAAKESGQGQYLRQRTILSKFARRNVTNVYTQCIESVSQRLREKLAAFPEGLEEAWGVSLGRLREHLDLILDKLFAAVEVGGEERPVSEAQAAQWDIRQHVVQWKLEWRETVPEDLTEDVDIPEEYEDIPGRGYNAAVDDDDDEGDASMDTE